MNQPIENSNDSRHEKGAEASFLEDEVLDDREQDDQLLVAYLDGEMNSEDVAKLESRLSKEPELCEKLHGLQTAWDMLDQLPSAELPESFTRSTIEMVVQNGRKDVENKLFRNWKWPLRVAGAVILLATTASLSFALMRHYQLAPHRELLNNLAFFENVDTYGNIPNIEFLQKLNDNGVLPEQFVAIDDGLAHSIGNQRDASQREAEQTTESAQQRLDAMDEMQLVALRTKKDRFEESSAEEQKRLRELHQQITDLPESERLLMVAHHYEQWLKSISSSDRSKLLSLENADEQINVIARLRSVQEERILGSAGATALPQKDVAKFSDWVEQFVTDKSLQILQQTSPDRQRMFSRAYSRRIQPYAVILNHARSQAILLDEDSLHQINGVLSEDAKQILSDQGDRTAQLKLANAWTINACRAKLFPPVTDQMLFEFLNTLPQENRDRFEQMSPVQWRSELERLYYRDYRSN